MRLRWIATICVVVALAATALVYAAKNNDRFYELYVHQAQDSVCFTNDADGVANEADNYVCAQANGKDIAAGGIKYALVDPDGFRILSGAGARGLKLVNPNCVVRRFLGQSVCNPAAEIAIVGLQPETEYQVKLDSDGPGDEAEAFAAACAAPNLGYPWMCGYWEGKGFVVLDIVKTDRYGTLVYNPEQALPLAQGQYDGVNLVVTLNDEPWNNVAVSNDLFFIVTGTGP